MMISDYVLSGQTLFDHDIEKIVFSNNYYSFRLIYKKLYFNRLLFLVKSYNASHKTYNPDLRYILSSYDMLIDIKRKLIVFTTRSASGIVPIIYMRKLYMRKHAKRYIKNHKHHYLLKFSSFNSSDFVMIEDLPIGIVNYRKRKRKIVKLQIPYAKKYTVNLLRYSYGGNYNYSIV